MIEIDVVERIRLQENPQPSRGFSGLFVFEHEPVHPYPQLYKKALERMCRAPHLASGPFSIQNPNTHQPALFVVCSADDLEDAARFVVDQAFGKCLIPTSEPTRMAISLDDPTGPLSYDGWWSLSSSYPFAVFRDEHAARRWLQLARELGR